MAVKTEGGATLATYLYDALGHRVQTVVGSANTEFVFNPAGQRVSTWNGATGAQIQGQYYWGAKPVAFYKGGQTYFQHQDWEGTERLRTTYNGGVEGSFTSLPFGDALTTTSGSDNDAYHYGMLDHDSESDTEHAQFRQYNSAQGHWLSPDPYQGSYDPSNPQSFNRYVYALNNPLSNVDPSGHECVWDDGSYDSSDDPDTGDAEGCAAAGGNYVPPGMFEDLENTNPGDWNSNSNANIQFDWDTISATVNDFDAEPVVANYLSDVSTQFSYLVGVENVTPLDVFNWAAQGPHTPNGCASGIVGCLYHHGNWCGAGGSGAPVDATDAACMVHDFLYAKYGFTAGSNLNGYNPALQQINQGLCDTAGSGAISGYFGFGVAAVNIGSGAWAGNPSCQ